MKKLLFFLSLIIAAASYGQVPTVDPKGIAPSVSKLQERNIRWVLGVGFPQLIFDMGGYSCMTITIGNVVDAAAIRVESSNDGNSFGNTQVYCLSGKPGVPNPAGFYTFGVETFGAHRPGRFIRITQLSTGALSSITVNLFHGETNVVHSTDYAAYCWSYSGAITNTTPVTIAALPPGGNTSQRNQLTNSISGISLANSGDSATTVTIRTVDASPVTLFSAYLPGKSMGINRTFSPALRSVLGKAIEIVLSQVSGANVIANIQGIQTISSF